MVKDPKNNDLPQVENQRVPLWIKIMWLLGIAWVVAYIFLGLTQQL